MHYQVLLDGLLSQGLALKQWCQSTSTSTRIVDGNAEKRTRDRLGEKHVGSLWAMCHRQRHPSNKIVTEAKLEFQLIWTICEEFPPLRNWEP